MQVCVEKENEIEARGTALRLAGIFTGQREDMETKNRRLDVPYKASPEESSVSKGMGNRKVAMLMQSPTETTIEAMVTYQPPSGPQFVYWLTVPSPNCDWLEPLKIRQGPSRQELPLSWSLNP